MNLTVRPVSDRDCWLLLDWQNDPVTRVNSLHPRLITPQEHYHWFWSRFSGDSGCWAWILEDDGQPVALVRYERSGTLLEANLTVAPAHRGNHYGEHALRMTMPLVVRASGATRCRALVFADNVASLKSFGRAGYEPIGREAIVLERQAT